MRLPSLLVVVCSSALLGAQNASQGPIKVIGPLPFPALGPGGLSTPNCPVSKVRQLELRRHPSFSSPAVFYVVAAILAPNESRWKLCTGTFDCDQGTFVGDVVVDHTTDSIWAGTITPDLKTLVYETSTGFAWRTRGTSSGPFGIASAVSGAPAGARDPKLARDDGNVTKLMWALPTGAIQWAAYVVATGVVTGSAVNLVNATSPVFHSPEPIRDPAGITRALLLGKEIGAGSVSDAYYASGKFNLPPAVAHHVHNEGTYLRGGTALGGTAFMPQGPAFGDPLKIDFFGTNCDLQSGGGSATLCTFFPYKPVVAEVEFATVFLGVLGNAPITLPGINGRLGLDPAGPLVSLPVLVVPGYTGVSCWSIGVPIGIAAMDIATQAVLVRSSAHRWPAPYSPV
jgi:hypothetical protein